MKHLLLLAILIASSAQAFEPYVETGIAIRSASSVLPAGFTYKYDPNHFANPYMSIALGVQTDTIDFGPYAVKLSAELFHESSVATGQDRGLNEARVTMRITWRGE